VQHLHAALTGAADNAGAKFLSSWAHARKVKSLLCSSLAAALPLTSTLAAVGGRVVERALE
jgi:hypothetical protein